MTSRRTLLPVALVLAASFAAVARAERLDATVTLGSITNGSVDGAGDVASFGFLVSKGAGRALSLSVKRAKGSKLEPSVKLVAPDGQEFVLTSNGGSVKSGPTSWSAKLPNVPQSGLWRLEVRGANGTSGEFSASVKGKDVFKQAGTLTIPAGGKTEIEIDAGDGAALTVTASRNKSEVVEQLTILDSNGATVPGGPFVADAKGKLSVKGFLLPFFGHYTLRFTGRNGTGGGIKYSISAAIAKVTGAVPVANAGESIETEPGFVTQLDGSHSVPSSGGTLAYRWSQVSGPTVALIDAATSRPSFVAPPTESSIVFQLSVSEGNVKSRPSTVDLTVANRPVADAGSSMIVASSAAVTLDGSASFDRRGAGLGFSWRQVPGDTAQVTLAKANTAAPTFTAPSGNHTLHFGLTVDDGNARSFENVVVVEVGTANTSVADAGREQFVPRMASVHLCGLGSRNASGVLDAGFLWTQTSGPAVTLSGANTPWPSFTATRGVSDLEFQLTVNGVAATADRVAVHVRQLETNLPAPTEAQSPLNVAAGAIPLAVATGTSDPEGKTLHYRWAQVAGSAIPLSPPLADSPTATLGAADGLCLFGVMSNDGLQYGSPDLLSLRNTSFASAPVAVAGPNVAKPYSDTITVDGSGSARTDGGAGPITYQWTQVSGKDWFDVTTSAVPFDATAAKPQLLLPSDVSSLTPTRTIVLSLVVNDGTTSSRPDFVSVTFTGLPLNRSPVVGVTVSETNPIVGTLIRLDATATDRENDPMTYRWTQTSGPSTPLSPSNTSLSVTFIAGDATLPITFKLVANDGFEDSAPATGSVIVDRKPVAKINANPIAGTPGTAVTMDGSQSADPELKPITYTWTQILGATLPIADLHASSIAFTGPNEAVAFRLVVNDGRQNSDPQVAVFSSSAPPTGAPTVDRTTAAYGSTVTLDANPGPGGPFTYQWRQINQFGSDPVCTIQSPTSPVTTFTVPMPQNAPFGLNPQATFGLTVSFGAQSSSEYTVTVKFFASLDDRTQTQQTVYAIITNNCVSCHAGTSTSCPVGSGTTALGYGMATKSAFLTNSRGVVACATGGGPTPVKGGKFRLPQSGTTNGSGTAAYLFDRIKVGGATPRMPSNAAYLTQTEINFIQDWIDQGVQDN